MKLLVGLGNPGTEYARHRHNVGFMALDAIADRHRAPAWRQKFAGLASEIRIGDERALLVKPQTYMNESGRSVGEAARFLKIEAADVVVFHDELDLLPGRVRIKTGGGNAGHNGLRSISSVIGNDYVRVRIGIGHPGAKELVSGYVLSNFAKADQAWLTPLMEAVGEHAGLLLTGDHAGFLRKLADESGAGSDDKAAPARPTRAAEPGTRRGAGGHPAGEREGKRRSALAENLRKWLAGRTKAGDD